MTPAQVDLAWAISNGSSVKYHTEFSNLSESDADYLAVDGFILLDDAYQYDNVINHLATIDIKDASLLTGITPIDGGYRAKIEHAKSEEIFFQKNKNSIAERELIDGLAGYVKQVIDFDKKGNLLSFYLTRKQKNVGILFDLPEEILSVGDTWSMPWILTDMAAGYVPKNNKRVSRAKLDKIWLDERGNRMARFSYVIAEYVDAYAEKNVNGALQRIDANIKLSSVGYADFYVDKGYLYRHVSYLIWDYGFSNSKVVNRGNSIYAIELVDDENK